MTPEEITIDSKNLGVLCSFVRLEFENSIAVRKVKDFIILMKKFFSLIINRSEIYFEEIYLSQFIDNGFDRIANVIIDEKEKENIVPKNPNNIVNYDDIKENIVDLLTILYEKDVNTYHLPKNNRDSFIVTPEKYIFTSASFEYEFKKAYPNFKKSDENFHKITEKILAYLEKLYQESDESSEKKYINKYTKIVQFEEKSLEYRFNHCYKDNCKFMQDLLASIEKRYSLSFKKTNFGASFAESRNVLAHGGIIEYINKSAASFEIGRVLIYILILKRCNFKDDKIINIIRKNFL